MNAKNASAAAATADQETMDDAQSRANAGTKVSTYGDSTALAKTLPRGVAEVHPMVLSLQRVVVNLCSRHVSFIGLGGGFVMKVST